MSDLRRSYPVHILFEYEQNSYIPVFAKDENGVPYTGSANGSYNVADWSGEYLNGLPHGKFFLLLGGIHGKDIYYLNGKVIEKR